MKMLFSLIGLIALLSNLGIARAENKVETGDISASEIQIIQKDQPQITKSSPIQEVKTGKVDSSTMKITQESTNSSKKPKSTPWWTLFYKEILTGVISLFFALVLWHIKSRWGKHDD